MIPDNTKQQVTTIKQSQLSHHLLSSQRLTKYYY